MTIDDVIARMGWAAAPDLAITSLGGGITNLNYRVEARGQTCVVRIPGRDTAHLGIDRAREHACAVAAHRSGVAPAIVAFLEEDGVLITEFIRGRGVTVEEMQHPGMVRRVAETLRRYHGGPFFPGVFSPFRTVREYHAVAAARGAPLPERCDRMLAHADLLETALGGPGTLRPCHNDLLLGNFLDDGERLWILDWEYAAMGDVFFDLGNFAAHHQLSSTLENTLLEAYVGDVTAGAVARLKLMKIVSDLREAMWAMVQTAVSVIDYDFRTYGQKHFDRYTAQLADPRLTLWLDGAAAEGIA
jgi:thiamine kinase-like enzyme